MGKKNKNKGSKPKTPAPQANPPDEIAAGPDDIDREELGLRSQGDASQISEASEPIREDPTDTANIESKSEVGAEASNPTSPGA
eukprot:1180527-Prorocentrum_minimum.AAC.4